MWIARLFSYVVIPSILPILLLLSGNEGAALIVLVVQVTVAFAVGAAIENLYARVAELRTDVDRLRAESKTRSEEPGK
jgi:hypothetical protein